MKNHPKNKLKILSLNAWYGEMLSEISDYIESKKDSVSVFCFQEAGEEFRAAADQLLANDFTGYYSQKPSDDGSFYFMATYVRKGIVVDGIGDPLKETDGTGASLACSLQIAPDQRLLITSVHGAPRPGDKLDTPERIRQSEKLIDFGQAYDGYSVLIGDFNLMPNTEAIDRLEAGGYRNLISEFDIPTTRNDMAWSKYPDNKQLYADYAFILGDDGLEYDFAVENIVVSDHLPLILDLELKPQELQLAPQGGVRHNKR